MYARQTSESQSVAQSVRASCVASLQNLYLAKRSYEAAVYGTDTLNPPLDPEIMLKYSTDAEPYLSEAKKSIVSWELATADADSVEGYARELFQHTDELEFMFREAVPQQGSMGVVPVDVDVVKGHLYFVASAIGSLENLCRQEGGLPPR